MSLCRRPIRRIALAAKTGSLINRTARRSISQQNIYKQLASTHLNIQELQFINEEKQDDAIFKVYFKRIPHRSSTLSGSSSTLSTFTDDNNERHETTGEIQNADSGTLLYSTKKVYQLKAGTLEKIIECLTNETGELDVTHMHILFFTYRTFTKTRTLIETLTKRYRTVLPASLDMTEDIRRKTLKSLRTAITYFLNSHKKDFYEPPRYSSLNHFIRHIRDKDLQKQAETLLEELKHDDETIQSNIDDNNNKSNNDYLYNEKGLDYIKPWNILDMPSTMIAEQLTIVDADLFKHVVLHELLSPSTSNGPAQTQGKNSNSTLSTVKKTSDHFNAIVARVIATILKQMDEQTRARVIEKWIDVACQCRKLKSFSSLTAILNGLLSGCIYRLSRAWSYVSQSYRSVLEEIKKFSGTNQDRKQAREILEKPLDEIRLMLPEYTECATKYIDLTTAINATIGRKQRHKVLNDQQKLNTIGAVPYLGFYLHDLTYIDTAYRKTILIQNDNSTSSKELINFEKSRKQYEVLAQIKLFQSAVHAYSTLHPLPRFKVWFDNVRIYNNDESWKLSYQIEPREIIDNSQVHEKLSQNDGSRPNTMKPNIQRNPSEESLTSSNEHTGAMVTSATSLHSSPSLTSLDKISTVSINSLQQQYFQNLQPKTDKSSNITHSRSSSISSNITSSNGSSSQGYISATGSPKIGTNNTPTNPNEDETVIVKVRLSGKNDLLYKKVRISSDERTTSVLKKVLDKFGLDPSMYEKYCIEQQLPDRKIQIVDYCNVYYALARSSGDEQIELIVREKTAEERQAKSNSATNNTGHSRTPSGFSTASSIYSR